MNTQNLTSCESCLMPFSKDTGMREDARYCSYCFKDGKLCYEGDLKGFMKTVYEGMRSHGVNPITSYFFSRMVRFAPRWRGK
jgi:hypothetical protein